MVYRLVQSDQHKGFDFRSFMSIFALIFYFLNCPVGTDFAIIILFVRWRFWTMPGYKEDLRITFLMHFLSILWPRASCWSGSTRLWEPRFLLAFCSWHPYLEFCWAHCNGCSCKYGGVGFRSHLFFIATFFFKFCQRVVIIWSNSILYISFAPCLKSQKVKDQTNS